jgi:hypothetical protein
VSNGAAVGHQIHRERGMFQRFGVRSPLKSGGSFGLAAIPIALYFFRILLLLALQRIQIVFQVVEEAHAFSMTLEIGLLLSIVCATCYLVIELARVLCFVPA